MESHNSTENNFVKQLTDIVETNLSNPKFGVSMLTKEMGMSRSNLHRKVNDELKITVSQFINHARLKKAKEILRHTSNTVSEVAYEVGFSNVSYFIKCFHKYYGYSPGEIDNREEDDTKLKQSVYSNRKVLISSVSVIVIAAVLVLIFKPFPFQQNKLEKTIAILPLENYETSDTESIYGIMQSLHNNLSKIKNIKITPWLSVEQYKHSVKTAPEIARELKINYLVKPRVWKNNEKIILGVSLTDARKDKLLETFPYELDSNNITTVHLDILKDITEELDIPITQAEQVRIDKFITTDKKAYKQYYEGMKILNKWLLGKPTDLNEAIISFEKVIEYDIECAAAYAQIARIYYLMDYHWSDGSTPEYEILYGKQINKFADKAYRLDPQLDLSSIAKALYYINEKEYEMAIPYLQDALKYNPHSFFAVRQLSFLYAETMDTENSIRYALQSIKSDFPENDDPELGIESIYYRLAVQYRRLGFFDKAMDYFDQAEKANPELMVCNQKSQAICDLEEEDNYQQAINLLLECNKKDSTFNGYYFLGQAYYMLRDYQKAYNSFKKIFEIRGISEMDYPPGLASGRLAVIDKELGQPDKAKIHINKYKEWAEYREIPSNKCYYLTGYYSFLSNTAKALEQLTIASKYDHPYFRIRLLKDAPLYDKIRGLPQFQQLVSKMETRFYEKRDSIRVVFEEKDLL